MSLEIVTGWIIYEESGVTLEVYQVCCTIPPYAGFSYAAFKDRQVAENFKRWLETVDYEGCGLRDIENRLTDADRELKALIMERRQHVTFFAVPKRYDPFGRTEEA